MLGAALELDLEPGKEGEPTVRKRGGGPRTEEGKNASRWNSTRHSMRARVLLPAELEEVRARRCAEFAAEFTPATAYERVLVDRLAFASVQVDHGSELTLGDLRRVIDRAGSDWDGDRRREADRLGKRLAADPERVANLLKATRQGACWLIERWQGLERAVEAKECWDEDQRTLAFDLLGVSTILRDGCELVPDGSDAERLAALTRREIETLRAALDDYLIDLDESAAP